MYTDIATVIAQVLRGDLISGQASAWVDAYPTEFPSTGSVPLHFYTCLRDIWEQAVGATISDSDWENKYVVSSFGQGDSRSRTIDVCNVRTVDQADFPKGLPQSNTVGAEATEVWVYLKLPDQVPVPIANVVSEAELRIRRLIDYNYRVNTCRTRMFTAENASIVGDMKCYFQGFLQDDSKSSFIKYFCAYTRIFLPAPPGQPKP
jgi:hypothetical protein